MEAQVLSSSIQGGGFLIQSSAPEQTFTPEDFNDEQHMIIQMCHEFLEKEVWPHLVEIDQQKDNIMPKLVDKAGALGLLGAAFPEQYGGLGKDFITATLI